MRKLLYTTVTLNSEYVELLQLFCESLASSLDADPSGHNDLDLLVIADGPRQDLIEGSSWLRRVRDSRKSMAVYTMRVEEPADGDMANACKYLLPRWPSVQGYDAALFVDADCVFLRSPRPLFDAIPRDVDLAVKLERSFPMNGHYHARGHFGEAELAEQRARGIVSALNAGTFGFAVDAHHLGLLDEFREWMLRCMAVQRGFYDQTFYCIFFARRRVAVQPLTEAIDLGHREEVDAGKVVIFHAVGGSVRDKLTACREVLGQRQRDL